MTKKSTRSTNSDGDNDLTDRVRAISDNIYQLSESNDGIKNPNSDLGDFSPLYDSIRSITDRYQNPKLIGRGGMKEVFVVFDKKTNRQVALAKPLEKYSRDHFDAFLREAHLTARLEHPGIIGLFEMGIDENERPFFTMEFKRGMSLRQYIEELQHVKNEAGFSFRERVIIFKRICEAIAYAHSRRVLHLDIKPGNIQIGEFGEVQVCDWGLGVVMTHAGEEAGPERDDSASLLDPDLYGPLLSGIKGTPGYMAPEQMDRRQLKTPQMDIYALGCVLYELVSGQRYNQDTSLLKIDSAIAGIVRKSVAGNPQDRYESVTDLDSDITRYLSDHSTSVQTRSLYREASLFVKRHREAFIAIVAAATILSILLTLFVYHLVAKEKVAVEAQKEAETSLALYESKVEEADRLVQKLRFSNIYSETFRRGDVSFLTGENYAEHAHRAVNLYSEFCDAGAPPDSRGWEDLVWWQFVCQDFRAAVEVIKSGNGKISPEKVSLARYFAPLLNEQGYLETDSLIEFVGMLKDRTSLCARVIKYDLVHRRSVEDRVRILQAWVRNQNDDQKIQLHYDSASKTASLRGPVKELKCYLRLGNLVGYDVNFIASLQPIKLDLRGTQIRDLNQLRGLDMLEVDLRQIPAKNLKALNQFRSLRRIIVSQGQFTRRALKKLGSQVKVTVLPDEKPAAN